MQIIRSLAPSDYHVMVFPLVMLRSVPCGDVKKKQGDGAGHRRGEIGADACRRKEGLYRLDASKLDQYLTSLLLALPILLLAVNFDQPTPSHHSEAIEAIPVCCSVSFVVITQKSPPWTPVTVVNFRILEDLLLDTMMKGSQLSQCSLITMSTRSGTALMVFLYGLQTKALQT